MNGPDLAPLSDKVRLTDVRSIEAVAYIVAVLGDSRRALGEALKSNVDLSQGKVWTWAFGNREVPRDFAQGGLLPETKPDSWRHGPASVAKLVPSTSDALVQEIALFLSDDTLRLCLLANENVDPSDQIAAGYPAKVVHRGELYHLIPSGTSSDEIGRILKIAKSVPVFVGVLSATGTPVDPGRALLDEGLLREIVGNVQAIIIGAFDGEGFLLWRPRDSST